MKGLRDDHSDSPVDIEELQQRGMVSMCLGGGGRREGVCLEGVQRLFGECPKGVSRGCLDSGGCVWSSYVCRVCPYGVQRVSKGCPRGVRTVSGLEDVLRGVYLEVGGGVSKGGVSGKMICMEGCV